MRSKAPQGGFARRLVDHFQEHGEALDLASLLPLAERDWIDGLHRILPTNFDFPNGAAGAFTEGTFYPAFAKDLARARESVVILSPFATGKGTSRWTDMLHVATERGVKVRILTRPAEEFGGGGTNEVQELVAGLRASGIMVDYRARMHEKVAIIDGRTLWHGSLNILSHRDTHESMLRLDSPAACQQISRFLSAPAGRRGGEAEAPEAMANPLCPECSGPTIWNDGPHGIRFDCESPDCTGKVDARSFRGKPQPSGDTSRRSRSQRDRQQASEGPSSRPCPEPGCGGTLRLRNGRYGPFLGCSNYPTCRFTMDTD